MSCHLKFKYWPNHLEGGLLWKIFYILFGAISFKISQTKEQEQQAEAVLVSAIITGWSCFSVWDVWHIILQVNIKIFQLNVPHRVPLRRKYLKHKLLSCQLRDKVPTVMSVSTLSFCSRHFFFEGEISYNFGNIQ